MPVKKEFQPYRGLLFEEGPVKKIIEYLSKKPDYDKAYFESKDTYPAVPWAIEGLKHPVGAAFDLLSRGFKTPVGRELLKIESAIPSELRAEVESLKGGNFRESMMDASLRANGGNPVTYGDVALSVMPQNTPEGLKRGVAVGSALGGGIFLSPFNAAGFMGLTGKGLAIKKLAESGRTAEEIIALGKAENATKQAADLARNLERIIAEEGPAGVQKAKSAEEAIRRGHQQFLSGRNPLKPFQPDAPVIFQGPEFQRKLEGPLVAGTEQAANFAKRILPVSQVRQAFSNNAELPSEDIQAIHNAMAERMDYAKQVSAGTARQHQKQMGKDVLLESEPTDPFRRVLFRAGVGRKAKTTTDDLEKALRVVNEPFKVNDPVIHQAEFLRRIKTLDDNEIAALIYDPHMAGAVEGTLKDINVGIEVADRALIVNPTDEKALAMKQSLGNLMSKLEGTAFPVPDTELGFVPPTLSQLGGEISKTDKSIQQIQEAMRGLTKQAQDAMKRFDAGNTETMQVEIDHVKKLSAQQDDMGRRLQKLEAERGNLTSAQAAREELEKRAKDIVAMHSKGELVETRAVDVLPEVTTEIERSDKLAMKYATSNKRDAAFFQSQSNMLRSETVAERAARLSGGDPLKEEQLLSSYMAEAGSKLETAKPPLPGEPPVRVEPPSPNTIYKASHPIRADGTPVVEAGQPFKEPPKLTDEVITQSVDNNQSVMDAVNAYTSNADGSVDPVKARTAMQMLRENAAARENVARELSNDVVRANPKQKELARYFQNFFDDYALAQNEAGTLRGFLDSYVTLIVNNESAKGKGLRWFARQARRGDIPVAPHTKQRTISGALYEIKDAYKRAGMTDKHVTTDLLEISGAYSKNAERHMHFKSAMEDILGTFFVPVKGRLKEAQRLSPHGSLMQKLVESGYGKFSPNEIKNASEIDNALMWREEISGHNPVELGRMLNDAERTGGGMDRLPFGLKKVLAGKAEGLTINEALARTIEPGVNPIEGWSLDQFRHASESLTAELGALEGMRGLYPDVGMLVGRQGLDKVAQMTADELGEDGPAILEAIKEMASSQRPGVYHYPIRDELTSTFHKLAEDGKVEAWLGPKGAADNLNKYIKSFSARTADDVGKVDGLVQLLAGARSIYSRLQLMFPSTGFQNFFGNKYNTYVFGGQSPVSDVQWMEILGGDRSKVYRNVWNEEATGQELIDAAEKYGSTQHGMFSRETMDDFLKRHVNLGPLDYNQKFYEAVENQAKGAYHFDQWKKGLDHWHASQKVRMLLHDYLDLTTEERYLRLAAPFYVFPRKQIPLVLREFARRPYLMSMDYKIRDAISLALGQEFSGDEAAAEPEWMRESGLAVRTGERDGEVSAVNTATYSPIQPLREATQNPLQFLVGMGAPYFKTPVELKANKNFRTGQEIAPPGKTVPFLFWKTADPRWAYALNQMRVTKAGDVLLTGNLNENDKRTFWQKVAQEVTGFKDYDYDVGQGLDIRQRAIDEYNASQYKSDEERDRIGVNNDKLRDKMDREIDAKQAEFDVVTERPPRYRSGPRKLEGLTPEQRQFLELMDKQ